MDYFYKQQETIAQGTKRIAVEQINGALAEIDDPELPQDETVHQVRKRCKKIRALLKLVRHCTPDFDRTYQFENGWFKDAAKLLATIRDTDVVIETFDELVADADERTTEQITPLRSFLVPQSVPSVETERNSKNEQKIRDFRKKMELAKKRVSHWNIPDGSDFALIGSGFKKTYKRGRKALAAAEERSDPETWHEWRKRVKNHWYHLRLLEQTWQPPLKKIEKETYHLSDVLGDDHDLAVLKETLFRAAERTQAPSPVNPDTLPALERLVDEHRAALQREAIPLGRKLYTERPKEIVDRFRTYREVWKRSENPNDNQPAE